MKQSRLTFDDFWNFFGRQDVHWPFLEWTVTVTIVLLNEAPRHFFDQHFDCLWLTCSP